MFVVRAVERAGVCKKFYGEGGRVRMATNGMMADGSIVRLHGHR